MSEDTKYMEELVNNAEEIQIVGIIKPNEQTVTSSGAGLIGYNKELKEYVINKINDTEIVKEQKENPNINVFTGLEFSKDSESTFDFSQLSNEQKAYMATLTQEELAELMTTYTSNVNATYENFVFESALQI